MTFSVSKLETQLSFWFASVPCHVLAYCTNRVCGRSLVDCDYTAKDLQGRDAGSLALTGDAGEGKEWDSAASGAGQGRGKGEGPPASPDGDPGLIHLCRDVWLLSASTKVI